MNRHDEIQAMARDIASNIHLVPAKRDAMADDLIKLIGWMLAAQGKYLAVYAEGEMNDWLASGHRGGAKRFESIYKTGERMQDSARELVSECTNPKVDLERWTRPTPGDPCQCGHVPSVHKDGVCTGETYNREACVGGPCTDFVRKERTYGWFHQDRRPATFRTCVNTEDEQAIRDIVRDEIGRAVQRQEAMKKAALQQHWDSDAFKSQVDDLRQVGRRGAMTSSDEAVRRVRELHRKSANGDCVHCSEHDYPDYSVPYPCPTVRVLDEP